MSLEERLGYYFFDKSILARALTRRAYSLEQNDGQPPDQDAYSLLGNALIKMVLTELLIRTGYHSQFEITAFLLELTSEDNLARIGRALGAGYALKLSSEEKQQQAEDKPQVLAEAVEALLGGIYFDGGLSTARQAVCRLFKDSFPEVE